MLKAKIIITVLKACLWIALIGAGVWYLSSSINGGSFSYMSLENFLKATGACKDGVCDIAASSGCFLCHYVKHLFYTIGDAAHMFWEVLLENIWILLTLGFVVFLFSKTMWFINENNKSVAKLDTEAKNMKFGEWFEPVWKQALRVLVAGAFLGMIGYGGTTVLKTVTDITVRPVMYVGSTLAMAATGTVSVATCGDGTDIREDNILGPALQPFMCVIGNLNTIVLAGAAGGFALMNYAWMGMGGGLWTWVAGLALVLGALVIGFNIFFQILSVVFQLVFLIIFLPLIIAAWAYQNEWKTLEKVFPNAVSMLAKCAVRVLSVTLQILIMYAMVLFAAQEYFPGPPGTNNTYTPILPAGILQIGESAPPTNQNTNAQNASVMEVFAICERESTIQDEGVDKDRFVACFEREKRRVEAVYPGAFDFMKNGWEFFMMLLGLFLVYWYVIKKEIDGRLVGDDGPFEYGKYVKEVGQTLWNIPHNIGNMFTK
ncbi:MAG: hypothetical protein FWG80_04555 [Alphaproteobacteria bacterium]|nr:hypothetical protein [Alphaproteobacteria bacterium]